MDRPIQRLAELHDESSGSLEILDGERVILLGASGSGKTVIVKRLLGLSGHLTRRRGSPLAKTCAYVPQTDGVFLDATVLENVTRPSARVTPVPRHDALDFLDLVGVSALAARQSSDLSPAERRRVALARALSRRRPLLVIDGDLDPTIGALLPDLLNTIPHLRSLLTTSCVADKRVWRADRVALVNEGRVLAQEPMESVVSFTDADIRAALAWVTP